MVGPPIMKDLSSGANERPRQVLQLDVRNQVVGGTGSRGCDAVTRASTAGPSAAPYRRKVLLAVSPLAGNASASWRDQALCTAFRTADGPIVDGRTH